MTPETIRDINNLVEKELLHDLAVYLISYAREGAEDAENVFRVFRALPGVADQVYGQVVQQFFFHQVVNVSNGLGRHSFSSLSRQRHDFFYVDTLPQREEFQFPDLAFQFNYLFHDHLELIHLMRVYLVVRCYAH